MLKKKKQTHRNVHLKAEKKHKRKNAIDLVCILLYVTKAYNRSNLILRGKKPLNSPFSDMEQQFDTNIHP